MKKLLFAIGLMLQAVVMTATLSAQVPVKFKAEYVRDGDRMVVKVLFLTEQPAGSGKYKTTLNILDPAQGAPYDPSSYVLKDSSGTAVAVAPLNENAVPGLVSKILLKPAELLKRDNYTLTVINKKLVFNLGGSTLTLNEDSTVPIPKSGIDMNLDFYQRQQGFVTENKIELGGGTAGGVGVVRVVLERGDIADKDWLALRLAGSADLTLDSDDRAEFFNNVSGEVNLLARTGIPGTNSVDPRYWEFSVHGKTESDQAFKTTDGLVGFKFGIYPKDPVTRWLGTFFVRTNNHVGPLVFVGYDFVHNLGGDAATNAAVSGVDTTRADHRATALLRWRVPVMRDFDLAFIPTLSGHYNIDMDLELKGVYDVNADKFLDQSRVSLDFTPINTSDRFKPAFVLTWARGKEGPTWQEVNALLAGLKLSF